jgi:hypothetical protein
VTRGIYITDINQLHDQTHSVSHTLLYKHTPTYTNEYSAPLELVSSTVGGLVRLHRQQRPLGTESEKASASSSGVVQTWEEATFFQAAPNVACMVSRAVVCVCVCVCLCVCLCVCVCVFRVCTSVVRVR